MFFPPIFFSCRDESYLFFSSCCCCCCVDLLQQCKMVLEIFWNLLQSRRLNREWNVQNHTSIPRWPLFYITIVEIFFSFLFWPQIAKIDIFIAGPKKKNSVTVISCFDGKETRAQSAQAQPKEIKRLIYAVARFRSSVQKVEYYDCYPINLNIWSCYNMLNMIILNQWMAARNAKWPLLNGIALKREEVKHAMHTHSLDRVMISFRSVNCVVPFDVSCILCLCSCTHWSSQVKLSAQVISCYFHARQKLDSN